MNTSTCRSCIFCDDHLCRRYAPKPATVRIEHGVGDRTHYVAAYWPVIDPNHDVCGEWQPHEENRSK